VRWQESVQRMVADGVTLFVEIGAGKVLTGLIKRVDKTVKCVNVQAPADFEAARAAIAEARAS
jgi:[acyl-carrier-protein] S-malonyltransferase